MGLAYEHRAIRSAGGCTSRSQAGYLDFSPVRIGSKAEQGAGLECRRTRHGESAHTPDGLISGYLDPTLLGADRWLALIGAWTRARTALCVVDAGTAVKVDSVDSNGQHLGGLLAPGIHMMREALMSNTSDIAQAAFNSTPSLAGVLANNTIAAVSRGAVFALAGMADRAAEVIEQSTGAAPKLFITGGDANMIAGTMRARGEIVPDLVLQGLAVIAAQPR
jgi:type III pantothenate kinase